MKKTVKEQEKYIKYCLFQKQNGNVNKMWQVCVGKMEKINNFQIVGQ